MWLHSGERSFLRDVRDHWGRFPDRFLTFITCCHDYWHRATQRNSADVSSSIRRRTYSNCQICFYILARSVFDFAFIYFPCRWAFSKGPIHMVRPWRRPSSNLRHPLKLRSKTEPRMQLLQTTGIIITLAGKEGKM